VLQIRASPSSKPLEKSIKLVVKIITPDFDKVFDVSNRVLYIAPHPDDCEVGVEGTIAFTTC